MKCFLSFLSLLLLCAPGFAEMRIWRDQQGNCIEGEFVKTLSNKVLLEDPWKGKHFIPLKNLSKEDVVYLKSIFIPELTFRFYTKSRAKWRTEHALAEDRIEIITGHLDIQAKGEMESNSLRAEVYMVGKEVATDDYRITQKKIFPLNFTEENKYQVQFELETESRRYMEYNYEERGTLYDGYLIVVLDRNGKVIQHKSNLSWLDDREVEQIRSFPVNAFFNDECKRKSPPHPLFSSERVGVQ